MVLLLTALMESSRSWWQRRERYTLSGFLISGQHYSPIRRENMKIHRQRTLLLVSLLLLFVPIMMAQVDTGAIAGTVRDASGAVIPGATVMMTNQNLGVSSQTTTNSE